MGEEVVRPLRMIPGGRVETPLSVPLRLLPFCSLCSSSASCFNAGVSGPGPSALPPGQHFLGPSAACSTHSSCRRISGLTSVVPGPGPHGSKLPAALQNCPFWTKDTAKLSGGRQTRGGSPIMEWTEPIVPWATPLPHTGGLLSSVKIVSSFFRLHFMIFIKIYIFFIN